MLTKVEKLGNGNGLKLPNRILTKARIAAGDEVEVFAEEEQIVIKKPGKPKFDLAELVAQIPPDYEVHEESFGPPVGKEVW